MGLFGTNRQLENRGSSTPPDERGPINEVCFVEMWVADDQRKNFALSRVNPRDKTQTYKTFRAQDLGKITSAIGLLAGVFSNDVTLSAPLREQLGTLSADIESVVEKAKQKLLERENGQATTASFLHAA